MTQSEHSRWNLWAYMSPPHTILTHHGHPHVPSHSQRCFCQGKSQQADEKAHTSQAPLCFPELLPCSSVHDGAEAGAASHGTLPVVVWALEVASLGHQVEILQDLWGLA